jgi:hypothetical protein
MVGTDVARRSAGEHTVGRHPWVRFVRPP